jgi:hypothetical protein
MTLFGSAQRSIVLIDALPNSEKIEYLIVGGYAVSYHGYPRPTGDRLVRSSRMPSAASLAGIATDHIHAYHPPVR